MAQQKFNINTMLKQNGGPVTIQSVLIDSRFLKPESIDAIRNAAISGAVNKAYELWGPGQALTVRDLFATDMDYPAPLGVFEETANAAIGWNAMAFGAFQVHTATVIGIYGVALNAHYDAADESVPITGIRFDIGGSRVAQWMVQPLDKMSGAAAAEAVGMLCGVTKSPIIVAEDITVTIFEYTRLVDETYDCVWLGVAVEKEGVTLKP